jgi:hypothetical protein
MKPDQQYINERNKLIPIAEEKADAYYGPCGPYDTKKREQWYADWSHAIGGNMEKLCAHCGKPFTPNIKAQKYCSPCAVIQHKKHSSDYYYNHIDHCRDLKKSQIEKYGLCTCCGWNPRALGNRFLCNLCYENDGDDWLKQQNYDAHKKKVEKKRLQLGGAA